MKVFDWIDGLVDSVLSVLSLLGSLILVVSVVVVLGLVLSVLWRRRGLRVFREHLETLSLPPSFIVMMEHGYRVSSMRELVRSSPRDVENRGLSHCVDLTLFSLGFVDHFEHDRVSMTVDESRSSVRRVLVSLRTRNTSGIKMFDLEKELDSIVEAWGADSARVFSTSAHELVFALNYGSNDFLYETIHWNESARAHDDIPQRVPMGVDELGSLVSVPVVDGHTLIAGKTGAGKGSVIWNIVGALCGREDVEIHGVDLKGGVEFLTNSDVFHSLATSHDELSDAVGYLYDEMENRLSMMGGELRKIEPSAETPLMVLVIDEAADIDELASDKDYKDTIREFKELLRKARAAGIVIVAATQNPNVSAFQFSKYFTGQVALRMSDGQQMGFIGAESLEVYRLDDLPQDVKGVCLVKSGSGDFSLCKAFFPDDDVIRGLPGALVSDEVVG